MHISLTEKLDLYVREKVQSGLYNNASEVVREALRVQIKQEAQYDADLEALRAELDKGIAQADAGLATPFDFDALNARLDKLSDG